MPKIKEINLGFDRIAQIETATMKDGYSETDGGATDLSDNDAIFSLGKAIKVDLTQLFTMATPPAYLGDCDMGYLKFGNDWLTIGTYMEEAPDRADRGQLRALAHVRMERQRAIKASQGSTERVMGHAFKYLAIAMAVVAVVTSITIAFLALTKGSPA